MGEGVCPANLAGRTLADLVTETDSDRAKLPWVGWESRKWEPEPFRWLGVRGTRGVMFRADQKEAATGKTSKSGALAAKLL